MATVLPAPESDDGALMRSEASSAYDVVDVYVQYGHEGKRVPLGSVSGCAQSSLKKLREQLHQQLDADDLPTDPFNFVLREAICPSRAAKKKRPKYQARKSRSE